MSAAARAPDSEPAAGLRPALASVEEIKRQRREQRERDRASHDPLSDCRIMMRFVLESKKALTPEIEASVARLDSYLVKPEIDLPPISEAPLKLLTYVPPGDAPGTGSVAAAAGGEQTPDAATELDRLPPVQLLLRIHHQLSELIAPATPETLRVSEGINGVGFWSGVPAVIRLATLMALLGLILFMRSFQRVRDEAKAKPTPVPAAAIATPTPAPPRPPGA